MDNVTCEVLGIKEITSDILQSRLNLIEAFNGNKLVYHFKDGTSKEIIWDYPSRAKSWTHEMREQARQRAKLQKRKRRENAGSKSNQSEG